MLRIVRTTTNGLTGTSLGRVCCPAMRIQFNPFSSSERPPEPESPKKYGWFAITPKIKRLILKTGLTTDEDMANLIAKSAAIGVWGLAGATVLGTIGVDTTPLIAGIGITGFTAGFALREIATNFLSGILLVLDKPFHKGQNLKVLVAGNYIPEGVVQSIDIRYVILKDDKGKVLMIPSALVYSSPLLVDERK
jgi:small conductance mechanosensitive channel